jgi:serine/threonine protein phosphatase PrpC
MEPAGEVSDFTRDLAATKPQLCPIAASSLFVSLSSAGFGASAPFREARDELSTLTAKATHWDVAACTDKGLVRPTNEDNFRISPERNLFVLSDGMGGAANGEVASAIAVEAVFAPPHENGSAAFGNSTARSEFSPDKNPVTNALVRAIEFANRKVHEEAMRDPASRGMGATIVAVHITGSRLALAHVGDSRAYLFRANALEQLTADHSLVAEQVRHGLMTHEQAATSELQSVLTRALGMEENVEIDADEIELLPRDSVLLCSDGLTRMVSETEIAGILVQAPNARMAAERLVQRANECGGHDNVTVIVIRESGRSKGWFAKFFPSWCSNVF